MIPAHPTTDDLDALYPALALDFPEASHDIFKRALQRSFIRFCEHSNFWHLDLDPVVFVDGVTNYELSAGANYAVMDVLRVVVDGKEVRQSAKDMGIQARWTTRSADSIDLHNLPDGAEAIITVSIKPVVVDGEITMSATILSDYEDAILDGARALIFKMPRKEWTDLGQYELHEGYFRREATMARVRQADNFSRAPRGVPDKPRDYF